LCGRGKLGVEVVVTIFIRVDAYTRIKDLGRSRIESGADQGRRKKVAVVRENCLIRMVVRRPLLRGFLHDHAQHFIRDSEEGEVIASGGDIHHREDMKSVK
jgi:hypothetical protein